MKQKVSDYMADFLVAHGITELFTVIGGSAMYMNDSFGHKEGLSCLYQHHEQACAMAAEACARVSGKTAAVCVTAGPGATNAITGALGGYMGSVPMLIFSGQVRLAVSVHATDLPLRSMGVQECNIIPIVAPVCKYAVMLTDPQKVRYHLEAALYHASGGRPGPAWIDVPLDIQRTIIDPDTLAGFIPDGSEKAPSVPEETLRLILDKLKKAKRPVLFAGHGVRFAGASDAFIEMAERFGVPVVTGFGSVDAIPFDHPLFVGRSGSAGSRSGNFAVQNSDLLFSIGCRQSFSNTGFNYQSWARAAYTIIADIDEAEIHKPNLHLDIPVVCDAGELIGCLLEALKEAGADREKPYNESESWREKCRFWKARYPVVTKRHYETIEEGCSNIYAFYEELSKALKEGDILCVSAGTSRVVGSQAFRVKKGQRFITNPNMAAMGFDLPAVEGAYRAVKGTRRIIAVTGEGSLQMNLQELAVIAHHHMDMHLFVINNQGYHSIRQTQKAYFEGRFVGIGSQSGDLCFPDLAKLALAYGIDYLCCHDSKDLKVAIERALEHPGPVICEIFVTKEQSTESRTTSRRLQDGSLVTVPLEDLYPFLPREELREQMLIPIDPESEQV